MKQPEKCVSCERWIESVEQCFIWYNPETQWRLYGHCSHATHVVKEEKDKDKKRVGQQKQKKKTKKR